MLGLTQVRLKEVLNYDPETGVFTWLPSNRPGPKRGDGVGTPDSSGYQQICVDGQKHTSHRLAFLYMHGYFPEYDVDHINGIKDDNRFSNLREVSRACNMQNCRVSKANTSGFSGVTWDKQNRLWRAQLYLRGKTLYLGCYDTALDAALARITSEDWCPEWGCDKRNVNRERVFAALRGL